MVCFFSLIYSFKIFRHMEYVGLHCFLASGLADVGAGLVQGAMGTPNGELNLYEGVVEDFSE